MTILLTQVNVTCLPPARHGGPHGRDQPPAAVATPGSGLAGTGTRTGVSPNLLAVRRKPSLSQALGHRLAVTLGLVRVAGRSGPSCRPQGGARERGEDLLLCVGVCPRDPGDPGSPTPLQAGGSSSCLAARLLSVFYLFFLLASLLALDGVASQSPCGLGKASNTRQSSPGGSQSRSGALL